MKFHPKNQGIRINKRIIALITKWLVIFLLLIGIVNILDALQKSKQKIWPIDILSSTFPLFDNIEALSIIAGLIAFASDVPNQQKKSQYEAWQVINSAQGQKGSGGRIQALQDLVQDGVSLTGIIAEDAYLKGIKLKGAELIEANLKNSKLENSDFKSADLSGANLNGTIIDLETKIDNKWRLVWEIVNQGTEARKLSYTDLSGANLSHAYLGLSRDTCKTGHDAKFY